MSPIEIVALLAMTGYALYRQTVVTEAKGRGRFTIAIVYGCVAVAVGGFMLPSGGLGWTLLVLSLALSAVVGVVRGRRTDVWMEPDGRVVRRGNVTTVALFLGLIAAKFALGTVVYLTHIDDGGGFGEVLVMIAIMVAVQAEIVHRRSEALVASMMRFPQTA